jgi:hypothetical protein
VTRGHKATGPEKFKDSRAAEGKTLGVLGFFLGSESVIEKVYHAKTDNITDYRNMRSLSFCSYRSFAGI